VRHEDILEEVKRLVCEQLASAKARVFLFGSWARQEERRTSDIDLGIWYDKPLLPGTLARLRMLLEESRVPYRVEVIDLTRADREFRERVMEEGIEWTDCGGE